MVKQLSILLFGTLLLVFVFGGCSDETVVPNNNTQNTLTTLVEGDIDPNGGDFEFIVDSAGEGTDQPGPFAILGALLSGQQGAGRDIVLLNAAAALWVAGKTDGIGDGIVMAVEAIDSGRVTEKLKQLIYFTQAAA